MISGQKILEYQSLWDRLAGAHFHRVDAEGVLEHQGIVEEVRDRNTLRVRYYSWIDSSPSKNDDLVCRLELERYRFYSSATDMSRA